MSAYVRNLEPRIATQPIFLSIKRRCALRRDIQSASSYSMMRGASVLTSQRPSACAIGKSPEGDFEFVTPFLELGRPIS